MNRETLVSVCMVLVFGCAHNRPIEHADPPKTLAQESAAAFVQDCIKAWSKKDNALWDKIVDGSFFPKGALPSLLSEEMNPSFDIWRTSMPSLAEWMSDHSFSEVGVSLRLVEGIKATEMRDLRHLSLEQLRRSPNTEIVIPTVQVQTLTLGLDMNGDGEISSREKTRVHLHNGVLYWEPFGW